MQTSWSCQSKCQRLRAALLVHNFPLSWIYVKHVHRVVLLLNRLCRGLWFTPFHRALISTLIFLLLLCSFCVAVKYNASLQKCNLVTDAIWKLVWSHLQNTWWGKGSLLKADSADRARCGQMLYIPLNPWNPPTLSLKKGTHLQQKFWARVREGFK